MDFGGLYVSLEHVRNTLFVSTDQDKVILLLVHRRRYACDLTFEDLLCIKRKRETQVTWAVVCSLFLVWTQRSRDRELCTVIISLSCVQKKIGFISTWMRHLRILSVPFLVGSAVRVVAHYVHLLPARDWRRWHPLRPSRLLIVLSRHLFSSP